MNHIKYLVDSVKQGRIGCYSYTDKDGKTTYKFMTEVKATYLKGENILKAVGEFSLDSIPVESISKLYNAGRGYTGGVR